MEDFHQKRILHTPSVSYSNFLKAIWDLIEKQFNPQRLSFFVSFVSVISWFETFAISDQSGRGDPIANVEYGDTWPLSAGCQ